MIARIEILRTLLLILLIPAIAFQSKAQQVNCTFKDPAVNITFGSGSSRDINTSMSYRYGQVPGYCPTDGHYTYTSYTKDCFRGDWFTLTEDHTPGDAEGNMLLVNSSPRSGVFLTTTVNGLKGSTMYEFGVWMMNVCRITEKCPFPLLPDITISLQTPAGKTVAQLATGEVLRVTSPQWRQYQFQFTMPAGETSLNLVMINHAPGGCGNDFALDDITFRECVIQTVTTPPKKPPVVKTPPKTTPAVKSRPKTTPAVKTPPKTNPVVRTPPKTTPVIKKQASTPKPAVRKAPVAAVKKPATKPLRADTQKIGEVKPDPTGLSSPVIKQRTLTLPPPPPIIRSRTNSLAKLIETKTGEIRVDLYDNGEIDGDTVSIYHNNRLHTSRARLSQKPITFRISVNRAQPHHELIMVAENLGSIPPNTSLMIVTAGDKRYEVFISSTKQKNAKVVFNLKE